MIIQSQRGKSVLYCGLEKVHSPHEPNYASGFIRLHYDLLSDFWLSLIMTQADVQSMVFAFC